MHSLFLLFALVLLSGCASLPTEVERPVSSHTDRAGEPSRLANDAAPYLRKHPGKSGFWLLGDGLDAYAARILLADAADRTIDVQYYLYHAKYRKPLLRGGVEIYESKPDADTAGKGKFSKLGGSPGASLHAKSSVYDREALFVGSANLDPRSGKLNTELGILFQSEPLAQGLADWFDENQARIAYRVSLDRNQCGDRWRCEGRLRWTDERGGRNVVYVKDPETGALTRFFVSLISLLPIEGQL